MNSTVPRFVGVLITMLCTLCFCPIAYSQDEMKKLFEEKLFRSFLIDQFIEEKIVYLEEKPKSPLIDHFLSSMKKFKSNSFKNLFTGYIKEKFTLDEAKELNFFYEARKDFFLRTKSPQFQRKFCGLIADLSLLLANVPDDDESGQGGIYYKNNIAIPNSSEPGKNISPNASSSTFEKLPPSEISTSTNQLLDSEKRFGLGEFVAPSRDEELHYIKIEVELGYEGDSPEILDKNKNQLRDAVNTILMHLSIQRAKEDYIDHFLHKDIQKKIQTILDQISPNKIKIKKVFIPVFLIN